MNIFDNPKNKKINQNNSEKTKIRYLKRYLFDQSHFLAKYLRLLCISALQCSVDQLRAVRAPAISGDDDDDEKGNHSRIIQVAGERARCRRRSARANVAIAASFAVAGFRDDRACTVTFADEVPLLYGHIQGY